MQRSRSPFARIPMHVLAMFVVACTGAGCGDDSADSRTEALLGVDPPPLPLPLPLPPPPLPVTLGPPELPILDSLPQILPLDAPEESSSSEPQLPSPRLDAKLLVISADGTEPVLGAIRQTADYIGVPYTLWIASDHPGEFTSAMLADADHGHYQGIFLTTGSLGYFDGVAWTSAFTAAEWQALWDYQAKFGVRTVVGYTFPTADFGFSGEPSAVDTGASPLAATLTAEGQTVFSYVNPDNPITIKHAYTYLAPAAVGDTTVLLEDDLGNALALVRRYPDGREVLSATFDGNFFLVHSLALAYGLLDWVTGGLFLGERRIYLSPQVDDIFLDNDVYGGGIYRMNAVDWTATTAWQEARELFDQTGAVKIHMAFNGEGTTGIYFPDTLTAAAELTQGLFPWINHTYTHENLDAVDYDTATDEFERNHDTAESMGFTSYDRESLVTPDISGLSNPDAMAAAYDAGVRYVVSDTSRPGMDNPSPNAGLANWEEPGIFMIPRRPNNLYYNVTTRTQWRNEYNSIYRTYWGRDLTIAEIIDKESDVLLQYLLRGEMDPWMFHQANLRAYDGVHTLLGDLLDAALAKYEAIFLLPVLSPTMRSLGQTMEERTQYNRAGVTASFVRGDSIRLTTVEAAVVPVTGLGGLDAEEYGGQFVTRVSLEAGETITLDLE